MLVVCFIWIVSFLLYRMVRWLMKLQLSSINMDHTTEVKHHLSWKLVLVMTLQAQNRDSSINVYLCSNTLILCFLLFAVTLYSWMRIKINALMFYFGDPVPLNDLYLHSIHTCTTYAMDGKYEYVVVYDFMLCSSISFYSYSCYVHLALFYTSFTLILLVLPKFLSPSLSLQIKRKLKELCPELTTVFLVQPPHYWMLQISLCIIIVIIIRWRRLELGDNGLFFSGRSVGAAGGGYLGLERSSLNLIRGNHPLDNAGGWNEALNQWIKQNYKTEIHGMLSWRTLLRAIARVDKSLFKKLAIKHGI